MWLVTLITGFSVLGWFINTYPPDSLLMYGMFSLILCSTIFFPSYFLLKNARRGALITAGIAIWLTLRLFGLREWYYIALLIPILISLEILFRSG